MFAPAKADGSTRNEASKGKGMIESSLIDRNVKPREIKVRLLKDGPPNSTIFVLGATGCGKTTLIAHLLEDEPRFLIFDAKNDYEASFFADCVAVDKATKVLDELNKGTKRIIFKVPYSETVVDEMDLALLWCYKFQQRNATKLPPITVAMDELNRFADSNNWPPALEEVIQRGRDYYIRKIWGAQWFGSIPTWVRDSFTEIYTFKHTDDAGLDRLSSYGFFSEDVRNLPLHMCLHCGKGEIELVKLIGVKVK